MSTRGCIARPVGDEWEGRYHHFDSYPDGLGASLWQLVGQWGVERARHVLIDEHPAGWSSINGVDWSLPPGYVNARLDARESGTCPPICYCHGDRNEKAGMIHSRDAETDPSTPLFIEWVYVLGEAAMTVYASVPVGPERWGWTHAGTFPWTGPEPAWEALGEAVLATREAAYTRVKAEAPPPEPKRTTTKRRAKR